MKNLPDQIDTEPVSSVSSEKFLDTGRRIYRNPKEKVVAGVASGLASYFHVDIDLVRLTFIMLVFAGGLGIILYIPLWMLTPEAKSAQQRLELFGMPASFDALARRIKVRFDEIKRIDGKVRDVLAMPFLFIKNVFDFIAKKLLPFTGKVLGVSYSFAGLFLISIGMGLMTARLGGDYVVVVAVAIPLLFLYSFGNAVRRQE